MNHNMRDFLLVISSASENCDLLQTCCLLLIAIWLPSFQRFIFYFLEPKREFRFGHLCHHLICYQEKHQRRIWEIQQEASQLKLCLCWTPFIRPSCLLCNTIWRLLSKDFWTVNYKIDIFKFSFETLSRLWTKMSQAFFKSGNLIERAKAIVETISPGNNRFWYCCYCLMMVN